MSAPFPLFLPFPTGKFQILSAYFEYKEDRSLFYDVLLTPCSANRPSIEVPEPLFFLLFIAPISPFPPPLHRPLEDFFFLRSPSSEKKPTLTFPLFKHFI